jgi:hypothetical protein
MARAYNVYILTYEGEPTWAFTVRHQCGKFLETLNDTERYLCDVYVARDASDGVTKRMTVDEFLNG